MSGNLLLKIGWRNDNDLWDDIDPEAVEPIREFIASIGSYKLTEENVRNVEAWLKKNVSHFYDQRYNSNLPRFRLTNFWNHLNDFEKIANRLIMSDYCNPGGDSVIQSMRVSVSNTMRLYNSFLLYG